MQKLKLGEAVAAAASDLARIDQRREDFAAFLCAFLLAARHEIAQIILEIGHRIDAAVELLLRQHRFECAEDFQ